MVKVSLLVYLSRKFKKRIHTTICLFILSILTFIQLCDANKYKITIISIYYLLNAKNNIKIKTTF